MVLVGHRTGSTPIASTYLCIRDLQCSCGSCNTISKTNSAKVCRIPVKSKGACGGVDAHGNCRHSESVSKEKKAKPADPAPTPGTIMGEKIRARANKLNDTEREALMGDAMRMIYGSQGDAVRAHRR